MRYWRLIAMVLVLFTLTFPVMTAADMRAAQEPSDVEDVTSEPQADGEEPTSPGQSEPRAEPAGTPAPATSVATPVPAATAPPSGPGTVLLADDFNDPARAVLPLSPTQSDRSQGYIEGEYEIRNGNPVAGSLEGVVIPGGPFGSTTIGVDVRVAGGPENQRGAFLACRATGQSNAGYRLRVYTGTGEFRLAKIMPGNDATLLFQPSTAIRRGDAMNRIELTCAGSTITATINQTIVATVQDTTYESGGLRMGVAGSGAVARFDNLVVTQQ